MLTCMQTPGPKIQGMLYTASVAYPVQGVHHLTMVGIVTIHPLSALLMARWTRNMVQQGCIRWLKGGHREGQGGPGHQKGGTAGMHEVITGGHKEGLWGPGHQRGHNNICMAKWSLEICPICRL
jgi:hypothetical protein